jgi:hypothetical protein
LLLLLLFLLLLLLSLPSAPTPVFLSLQQVLIQRA